MVNERTRASGSNRAATGSVLIWSRKKSSRAVSVHGTASTTSRQSLRRTKLVIKLNTPTSGNGAGRHIPLAAQRKTLDLGGTEERDEVPRLQRLDLVDIADQHDVIATNGAARDRSGQHDLRHLANAEQAHRGDEVEQHEGATRIVDADLEQESEEGEHQAGGEPADQDLAEFDVRLGAGGKIVVAAAAHAKDMDKAREQSDRAMRNQFRRGIADHALIDDPRHDAGEHDDKGIAGRQHIGHDVSSRTAPVVQLATCRVHPVFREYPIQSTFNPSRFAVSSANYLIPR